MDFGFNAHRNVVIIVAYPNGHSVGVFEDAIHHQFGFDFDASNFAKVCFDGLFALVCDVEVIDFVIEVDIYGELFSDGGGGIIQVTEVINGRGDVLGICGDGQFALFVSDFLIVVVVNGNILVEVGIFSYGFGISKWRL